MKSSALERREEARDDLTGVFKGLNRNVSAAKNVRSDTSIKICVLGLTEKLESDSRIES